MLDVVFVFAAALALVYWLLVSTRHPDNFPPGPSRFLALPVLGNALSIGANTTEGFARMRKCYGDIFGFYLGPVRTVVVHGMDLIQEVGASDSFSDRPFYDIAAHIRGGTVQSGGKPSIPGVLFSNGPVWVEQRRYTLHTLRNLGLGRNAMEEMMAEEVAELCKILEAEDGRNVDVRNIFNIAVLNSLWKVLSNERLSHQDPKLREIVRLLDLVMRESAKPLVIIALFYPAACRLLDWVGYLNGPKSFTALKVFLQGAIADHEATFDESNMRDFTDFYLREVNERSSSPEPSSFKGWEGGQNLKNVMIDLFFAGSETTSTTLNWGMLFMLNNPDVQKKVQQELDEVTGGARMPTMDDRSRTPYTEAVIHEMQRRGNIVNLAVPHFTSREATLGGYTIPEGTQVLLNLGDVMTDPAHFPDPGRFDPTRYLTPEGKFEPHPHVIPFGLGKRRCLGENLARMSLYMFFAGLLSRFELRKAEEGGDVVSGGLTEEPNFGATLSPKKYEMRFIPRN